MCINALIINLHELCSVYKYYPTEKAVYVPVHGNLTFGVNLILFKKNWQFNKFKNKRGNFLF